MDLHRRQGEVLGVNQSFASLGRILGPFLGSILFQLHESHTLPYAAAVLVLVFGSGIAPGTETSFGLNLGAAPKIKLPDLNTDELASAIRSVAGTARSMGIDVIG